MSCFINSFTQETARPTCVEPMFPRCFLRNRYRYRHQFSYPRFQRETRQIPPYVVILKAISFDSKSRKRNEAIRSQGSLAKQWHIREGRGGLRNTPARAAVRLNEGPPGRPHNTGVSGSENMSFSLKEPGGSAMFR